jgi:hypothetical protein
LKNYILLRGIQYNNIYSKHVLNEVFVDILYQVLYVYLYIWI